MEKQRKMKRYPGLASFRPDMAEQWHPTKNGRLSSRDVTARSGRKVWWVCEKGHEWQAVISSRSVGCGCPQCNPSTSFAEQALYFYIGQCYQAENRYRFMKKELDIYLPEFRIAVEHDGPCHLRKRVRQADAGKDALLRENGVYLIRVKDPFPFSVDEERSIIYYTYDENRREDLERAIRETLRLISRRTGRDWEADIDVNRDETAIRDRYKAYELERSIFAKVGEAKAYWDWEKNTLNPLYLTCGSPKKVHWKCSYGHEWTGSASDFARGGRCPVCQGRRVLAGFNDLATRKPELAEEWHPTRNGDVRPDAVTAMSQFKAWWICGEGHEWQAVVSSRFQGTGCPYCAGKKVLPGFNDLGTTDPGLAAQWHPTRNRPLGPDGVTAHSGKRVWWQCPQGHAWEAAVNSRASGSGCALCSGRRAQAGVTDLATTHPQLAREWAIGRNPGITPRDVTQGSEQKIWWRCQKGHEWQTAIYNRVRGSGCPVCSGHKVMEGYNDLATARADLAQEWHPTRNRADVTPRTLSPGSHYKAWWKCGLGHEWQAAVSNRAQGAGCPICAGKRARPAPGADAYPA